MADSGNIKPLKLSEFNLLIASIVQTPVTSNVWITAEISECNVRGGHCYLELVEKDENGSTAARSRAIIWSSVYYRLNPKFILATGRQLESGIKVMVRVSASFHPAHGYALVITDINPEFTIGDMMRIRREIIERLTAEGVIDMNRQLPWHEPMSNIAVISAPGAAGYGDFLHQLLTNRRCIRFDVGFFPAIMQGSKAAGSIINALEAIASDDSRQWDCVVIIRGGGATEDLACFENYDLAANIAQFPVPVIIGIGHERDVTLLDYVAAMRVKTPTAAAEYLIECGNSSLERLSRLSLEISHFASQTIADASAKLERVNALITPSAGNALRKASDDLDRRSSLLASVGKMRIAQARQNVDSTISSISEAIRRQISRQYERLDSDERLNNALSPLATLRRGYTITRFNDHAAASGKNIPPGSDVETIFFDGTLRSVAASFTPNTNDNDEKSS